MYNTYMLQEFAIPTATFLLGALFGFLLGWFVHKHISQREVENWERGLITVVVTFAWAVSTVFDVFVSGYNTPIAVHAVMGLVVGYFFEGSISDMFRR